jgi:hypothetical protein
MLIKKLLAHVERLRQQHWTALDFPAARIESRPAVPVIAMEFDGRTTAFEHVSLELLVDDQHRGFFAAVAPLGEDPTLQVAGFHVDVTIQLPASGPDVALKLLVNALRGWGSRQLASQPDGESAHVITVGGTAIRLQVEKTACPGEPGRLSILRTELPANFETVVSAALRNRLDTLLRTSADRHVLLFEKQNGLWSVGQLRTELQAALEFPELSRVHEIWMVDTRGSVSDDRLVFRCVLVGDV